VLLAGPQVDPGFEGGPHVAVCNLSPTEITLSYGEPFVTVEFHDLGEEVDRPSSGSYQGQDSITAQEIRDVRRGRGLALGEVIAAMRDLSKDLSELKGSVQHLDKRADDFVTTANQYMRIFVGTLVALVIGILGLLTNFLKLW